MIIAYAVSPIDLIPDFIPIIGYLDDIVLLPLGILLAIKLIPADVLSECRNKAAEISALNNRKVGLVVAAVIVAIWLLVVVWLLRLVAG